MPRFPAAELAWCSDRLSDKRGPLGDSLAGNVCGLETLGTLDGVSQAPAGRNRGLRFHQTAQNG